MFVYVCKYTLMDEMTYTFVCERTIWKVDSPSTNAGLRTDSGLWDDFSSKVFTN